MNPPEPPAEYDATDQRKLRAAVKRADAENRKRGQDVEIGAARLILTDLVTGARYSITMVSGTLTATAL